MKIASLIPTTKYREAVLPRRSISDGHFLDPSDPAILAITDFTREHPVTVDEERQIDDALHDMIHLGVRAMLVVRTARRGPDHLVRHPGREAAAVLADVDVHPAPRDSCRPHHDAVG